MKKGISTIIAILIILALTLGAALLVQKYTKIDDMSGPDINYTSPEDKQSSDQEEEKKEEEPEEKVKTPKDKVAIILDDLGNNFKTDKSLSGINQNITLAILPNREATLSSARYLSNFNNFQLILHLPLEPIDPKDTEEDMVMTDMNKEEIEIEVNDYLKEIGQYVVGANNHKGSKFTSNRNQMKNLLEVLKKKDLFFVDSFTYKDSIAYQVAKELNVKTARRDVFLDNSSNKEDIKARLDETVELAKANGTAIAIGHSRPSTISVLKEEMKKYKNVEFVKVSNLLE